MAGAQLTLRADVMATVVWSRQACGRPGCAAHRGCRCALCNEPIGVDEEDPRWQQHDEWCGGCELCQDQVPIILFRGQGKDTVAAHFHTACFNAALAKG